MDKLNVTLTLPIVAYFCMLIYYSATICLLDCDDRLNKRAFFIIVAEVAILTLLASLYVDLIFTPLTEK